jgi:Putative MetA-pathway of phenol degradation
MRTDTVTLTGNYGATDRLDIGAAVPFTRVRLLGERVDTYRGSAFTQATASAEASGLGDIVLRAKYNIVRTGASGLAFGAEAKFPTGNEENLLGTGEGSFAPRMMASYDGDYVGVHGEVAYSFGGIADTLSYGAAMTVVPSPRFTIVGELLGRRIDGLGQLVASTQPHPRLVGVQTIRLAAVEETIDSLVAVAGFKWNVGGAWLLTANILQPLTNVGLKANWVPTITFDYAFGG